jgi:hypothetical protein
MINNNVEERDKIVEECVVNIWIEVWKIVCHIDKSVEIFIDRRFFYLKTNEIHSKRFITQHHTHYFR